MPSFFTPYLQSQDKDIRIADEEFHHIVRVFRHQEKDSILLNNGKGLLAKARISSIQKRALTAQVIEIFPHTQSKPQVSVYFSLLRNKNDNILIEKLTELGVNRFYPFVSERSVKKSASLDKFRKISIAAIKQCDNAWLPAIQEVMDYEKLLESVAEKQGEQNIILAASERKASKYINEYLPQDLPSEVGLIIGPEGGFTDLEMNLLEQHKVPLFTLGKHILRAETAAICAVSQLLLVIGNSTR